MSNKCDDDGNSQTATTRQPMTTPGIHEGNSKSRGKGLISIADLGRIKHQTGSYSPVSSSDSVTTSTTLQTLEAELSTKEIDRTNGIKICKDDVVAPEKKPTEEAAPKKGGEDGSTCISANAVVDEEIRTEDAIPKVGSNDAPLPQRRVAEVGIVESGKPPKRHMGTKSPQTQKLAPADCKDKDGKHRLSLADASVPFGPDDIELYRHQQRVKKEQLKEQEMSSKSTSTSDSAMKSIGDGVAKAKDIKLASKLSTDDATKPSTMNQGPPSQLDAMSKSPVAYTGVVAAVEGKENQMVTRADGTNVGHMEQAAMPFPKPGAYAVPGKSASLASSEGDSFSSRVDSITPSITPVVATLAEDDDSQEERRRRESQLEVEELQRIRQMLGNVVHAQEVIPEATVIPVISPSPYQLHTRAQRRNQGGSMSDAASVASVSSNGSNTSSVNGKRSGRISSGSTAGSSNRSRLAGGGTARIQCETSKHHRTAKKHGIDYSKINLEKLALGGGGGGNNMMKKKHGIDYSRINVNLLVAAGGAGGEGGLGGEQCPGRCVTGVVRKKNLKDPPSTCSREKEEDKDKSNSTTKRKGGFLFSRR